MSELEVSNASNSNVSSSGAFIEQESSSEYNARRNATRVYLYEVFSRWREFREKYDLSRDADVAETLLDAFEATEATRQNFW